jgi:DNA-binding IclR family transcriptional regulator
MSQYEVLRLIEKHPQGLTAKQICKKTKLSPSPVNRVLKKLKDTGDIKVIKRRNIQYKGIETNVYFPK